MSSKRNWIGESGKKKRWRLVGCLRDDVDEENAVDGLKDLESMRAWQRRNAESAMLEVGLVRDGVGGWKARGT